MFFPPFNHGGPHATITALVEGMVPTHGDRSGRQIHIDVVRDEEIEFAVAVVVEKRATGVPAFADCRRRQLCADVSKACTSPLLWKKHVLPTDRRRTSLRIHHCRSRRCRLPVPSLNCATPAFAVTSVNVPSRLFSKRDARLALRLWEILRGREPIHAGKCRASRRCRSRRKATPQPVSRADICSSARRRKSCPAFRPDSLAALTKLKPRVNGLFAAGLLSAVCAQEFRSRAITARLPTRGLEQSGSGSAETNASGGAQNADTFLDRRVLEFVLTLLEKAAPLAKLGGRAPPL